MTRLQQPKLVPSKICAPRAERALPRPRLFDQLDAMHSATISWICAAPGAGKTTLAASYLARRDQSVIWFELGADDADSATFFHYLGRALANVGNADRVALPALLPAQLPTLARYTRRCAEAIADALAPGSVIVFDNYEQLPAASAVHEIVRDIACLLAPALRVIVLSRSEPPAAFARLRLNQALVLLGGAQLNLLADEAAALVAAHAPAAGASPPGLAEALLRESEGWVAGFTLLLAQRGDGPASAKGTSRQLLFDYFASELFERFDSSLQTALLCTALLPTISAAAATRLTAHPDVGAALADLQRRNCFCREHDGAGTGQVLYEYHALFRTFLLERAVTQIAQDDWRDLQRRAAGLLVESEQPEAAAALYRSAADCDGLAALVLREAERLLAAGRHRTLQDWVAALPIGTRARLPWLHHWEAMAWLPFDPARARSLFECAYRGFERGDDVTGMYTAWAGAMETFFYEWRDFHPADGWIDEFERLRERHPDYPSRAVELRTCAAMGTLMHRRPQHPLLPAWAERALALLDRGQPELSVLLGGYTIIFLLWRGRSADAQAIIDRIAPWIDATTPPVARILWCCATGFYHSVRGASAACRAAIDHGLAVAEDAALHAFDHLLAAQMARCSVITGDLAEAEPWLALMAATVRDSAHVDGAFLRHLRANVAAQRGDWAQALAHGRSGLALALASGVPVMVAHCHLDCARALVEYADSEDRERRAHLAAASAIARDMHSPALEALCLEAEAAAALQRGEPVTDGLAAAFVSGSMSDGASWHVSGPQALARMCDNALRATVAIEPVRRLVRERCLAPPDPAGAAALWPWPLRILTLGRFEVALDDVPLRASGKAQRKPLELLQCLCAFGTAAVAQDRVTDALWPDAQGDAADQALRTTLHRLRKLLQHERAVQLENRQLHLDAGCVWVDGVVFERIARQVDNVDVAQLRQALQTYRGVFLPSESAAWAVAHRDHLRARFVRLVERLGGLLEHAGDHDGAVDCYLHAIEVEPGAEGFYRRLMAVYALSGRRADAIGVYQRCRLALLSRLGVSPAADTQALHQELIAS
ncbi:BTAD domain-containing putative transcriptional regulator [Rhizobacter sp. OV335]|uniref:BTAD domain-containing putative transcriptional regulator n=1 Tax=Rhizobacter sp. OV335 TaxID=1500264 RepID=UPI0009242690|nr:BTAD domain-containing putative transcriptional regulator [Rhizobacter sp. OV335]SHN31478.1 ATP-, maltotriose-and DNA-dependent transcriptional regulator MalT [Rhizobacter sp. OV335]